jgi:Flp pilus assembly protein TadG
MTLSRIVTDLKSTFPRFVRAERGNVAMMFALMLPVLITSIGAAIDYSRAVNARSAMQAAADATALMISKEAASLTAAQITTKAQAYFNALYNHPEIGSVTFSAAYTANSGSGASVAVTAAGSMQTDFMKLAGISSMPINVAATTKWGNMRYRIALALDNTGSMGDADKMNQLQIATKQLITNFYNMASGNDDVYISIVPFAKDVNVGTANKNATWLRWTTGTDDDSFTNTAGTCSSNTWWTTYTKTTCPGTWTAISKNSWNGCVMDRDEDYDVAVDGLNSTPIGLMAPAEQYNACPTSILGMTSVKTGQSTLNSKVDAMSPNGGTNQAIGLTWAQKTLLASGPFTSPVAKDNNYTYIDAIILLTDGLNTQSRFYGNGSSHSDQIDARQMTSCTNIKGTGIKIFAVQVATDGDPVSTMLQQCTNDPTNPNYFSYITQASQMTVQFQNIFKELARLRVAS